MHMHLKLFAHVHSKLNVLIASYMNDIASNPSQSCKDKYHKSTCTSASEEFKLVGIL